MMDKYQQDLVVDFAVGKMSLAHFVNEFPFETRPTETFVIGQLGEAYTAKDKDVVECALTIGFLFDLFSKASVPIFCSLLAAEWHVKHEDLAFTLGLLREPHAVAPLFNAAGAHFGYLSFDDNQALHRKCIYALRNIGTTEAVARLEEIANWKLPGLSAEARVLLEVRKSDQAER